MMTNIKYINDYLGIPYEEHIVPFPNFGSVLLQHAREFPEKTAFQTIEQNISYSKLLQYCISFEIKDGQNGLLPLLAKLYKGIPFELNFKNSLNVKKIVSENEILNVDFFEPPYVRLDDIAIILNDMYEFSQYNVLVAAQAVGNAFKLFREGAAYCPPVIKSISDLLFGVLAPLYFGKSIHFILNDKPNFFQYAWNTPIESNLRDTVIVADKEGIKDAYRLKNSNDQTLGLGMVTSPAGEDVTFLGFEITNGKPGGHCLGRKIAL